MSDSLHVADGRLVTVWAAAAPFNSGELEVRVRREVSDVADLTDEEIDEVGDWLARLERVLAAVYGPDGVNMGTVSGPGGHGIVWRIVPRWSGDTNFMPVIAGVKVMPETPTQTAERVRHGLTQTPE